MSKSSFSVVMGLALLSMTASTAAPRDLSPPVLSPAQQASLDALVAKIKRTSRASFVRNDWTAFAQLYPPGVLDCWTPEATEDKYAFLSRRGIPDDARYELGRIENYYLGGNRDYSKLQATHYLIVSYESPYLAKCGNLRARTRPEEHFFLRQRGDAFELRHECPGAPVNLPSGASSRSRMLNNERMRAIAEDMSPSERMDLRQRLLAEPIPLNTVLGLQGRYRISDAEAHLVIDRVCELTRQQ